MEFTQEEIREHKLMTENYLIEQATGMAAGEVLAEYGMSELLSLHRILIFIIP
jgi:hypothetical protein